MSKPKTQVDATLLGHPTGLFVLFLTEMWERFSFYGMRAILVLFLVDHARGGLGWSQATALQVYGINLMAVYVLGIPGGIIADRYIGQRAAVLWGAVLQCIGHFLLALGSEHMFLLGLGFIALGTGLLKPNISTMVGGLYAQGDARRDAGFTIFYMGINIGAAVAASIVGFVGEVYGWHYGFSLAGFGMLIGIATFMGGSKYLKGVGVAAPQSQKKQHTVQQASSFTKEEWDRLVLIVISLIAVCAFFAAFEQAGGLMNLYTKQYTDRHVGGWEIPASIFQSLNPIFVILLGPIVALAWIKLAKPYPHLSSIYKMGIGNVIIGFGFLFMVGAVLERQGSLTDQSGMHWVVAAYLFHTIGELCLSPVSLSFITKVAPQRIKASMMGIYFATIGIAGWLSGEVGQLSVVWGEFAVFSFIAAFTALMGLPFIVFNKQIMKLAHGAEQTTPEQED